MNIALFGATGTIGKRILGEALRRGHDVTAVVRDPSRLAEADLQEMGTEMGTAKSKRGTLRVIEGDILMPDSIAKAAEGQDAVISAYGPRFGDEDELQEATRCLIEGTRRGGARRLIAVGGAGSLEVAPGVRLMDTPEFPEEIRPLARAHNEALALYQASDLGWTVICPPAVIEPGIRTGQFRIGLDRLITDERDQSRITVEDYAVALLDEVEDPQFQGARFTVAY